MYPKPHQNESNMVMKTRFSTIFDSLSTKIYQKKLNNFTKHQHFFTFVV